MGSPPKKMTLADLFFAAKHLEPCLDGLKGKSIFSMLSLIYITVFALEIAVRQNMKKNIAAFLEKATVFFIFTRALLAFSMKKSGYSGFHEKCGLVAFKAIFG